MTAYAIGDIQGCYKNFMCVLEQVDFNPKYDTLWVAGDMVNRGPENLATLKYLISLGDRVKTVLGNHDLHLLATAFNTRDMKPSDTFDDILNSREFDDIIAWLRHQPLLTVSPSPEFVMVHAGIPPIWSLEEAQERAREVEQILRSHQISDFLDHMYGNEPDTWSDELTGFERLRTITNYFTRMRFCDPNGKLEFTATAGAEQGPEGFLPWYAYPNRKTKEHRLIFGHWAGIEGHTNTPNVHALDTGCVWGRKITLLNLETLKRTSCDCSEQKE